MADLPYETAPAQPRSRRLGLCLGLIAFVVLWRLGHSSPEQAPVFRMAAVAALMAIWWITDAIPLAATSLLPIVLFPLLGIMKGKEVAPVYVNSIIFLFVGGFLIALAMERWNLHRRIALNVIRLVGSSPSRMVLGFMLATAFLSMWISNTATTIMMVAIALSVIQSAEDAFGKEATAGLSVAMLLGIAYSASIGGMATPVGTPPNLALMRIFEQSFPEAEAAGASLAFGQWMLLGLPLAVLLLGITWILLTRVFYRSPANLALSGEIIEEKRRALGPIRYEERVVLVVFAATALLWVFRKDLVLGTFTVPGWSNLLPSGSLLDDGTIAIAMALLLFVIPARRPAPAETDEAANRYGSILDFDVFARVPWHIVLLFGGGFALAKGFQTSGLSAWVGSGFGGLEGVPVIAIIAMLCGGLTFLTELTSNTATTEMILPLLASIAQSMKVHPLLLMVPATLSASCAFMMPVATPPNAIVFGSGRIRIAQMVKVGIVLNLIGIVVITVVFLFLGPLVFGIDLQAMPDWAEVQLP